MAVAFRSEAHAGYVSGSGNLTAASPAGSVQDDVLLGAILVGSGAASAPTIPTGWTSLFSGLTAAGGGNHFYFNLAWIVRGAVAPSLTWGNSVTAAYRELSVSAYSGADTVSPIDDAQTGGATNVINPNCPAATASAAGGVAVAVAMQWNGSTTAWAISGYTVRSSNAAGNDSIVASKALVAAGAEDPPAFTGGSTTNDAWQATVILKVPVVGGTAVQQTLSLMGVGS